jgi:hypothetical protein
MSLCRALSIEPTLLLHKACHDSEDAPDCCLADVRSLRPHVVLPRSKWCRLRIAPAAMVAALRWWQGAAGGWRHAVERRRRRARPACHFCLLDAFKQVLQQIAVLQFFGIVFWVLANTSLFVTLTHSQTHSHSHTLDG